MTAKKNPSELKPAGRPLTGEEPLVCRVHVSFGESERKALHKAALDLGVSVAEAVRRAVRQVYAGRGQS
jgi:hypothetical protein